MAAVEPVVMAPVAKSNDDAKKFRKFQATLPCPTLPERLFFYSFDGETRDASVAVSVASKKPIKVFPISNDAKLPEYLREAFAVALSFATNDTPLIRVLSETCTEKEILYASPVMAKDGSGEIVGALIAVDMVPDNQCPSPRDFVQSPLRSVSRSSSLDLLIDRLLHRNADSRRPEKVSA